LHPDGWPHASNIDLCYALAFDRIAATSKREENCMSNVPPSSPGGTGGTAPAGGDRQLMLALSYILFLGLIPLIVRKDDREITWHAKNGLLLFGVYVVIQILWSVLQWFLPPEIGCALGFASCAIFIAYIVVAIMAIMKALKGQRMRFPILSDIADK